MLVDGGGLVAGGFQRLPDGGWTIGPKVTGNVFAACPAMGTRPPCDRMRQRRFRLALVIEPLHG